LPTGELGVLDFQSAFRAPLVYDAVSLLRDCYIDWQPEQVDNWLLEFFTSSKLWQAHFADFTELKQAFDAVSLQRHLKCLGLFAHLLKSGQKDYESAMLRTLRYAKEVCEQQECWTAFLSAINAGINRYNQ
jgi:aminoglycoside/choline kinase family phosphotransferase